MNKKYLLFDIDGTLTDNNTKEIVPSALKALKQLEANGHFVALATGRAHYKAYKFMEQIGLKNMVCNGGNAIVIDKQLIENKPLNYDKALKLCEQADELGYGVCIAIDDSKDVYSKDYLFLKQAKRRKEPTRYIINHKLKYEDINAFYKIYISIPHDCESELTLKDTLGYLRFEQEYLMFQPDNKKNGIIKLMEYLKADIKDVVVFGDDYNDLIMFDNLWFSIAMGNACAGLKEKADYITDTNVSDGIYKACKKFGWIA